MAVTLIGTNHLLYLGSSEVSTEIPEITLGSPIKLFEVFYDERVIVGFHVVAIPGDQ